MVVDIDKLGVVGVDKLTLYNFKVENFETLEKKQIINSDGTIEKFERTSEVYSLNYSQVEKSNNKYNTSELVLNPAKILNGHNIYNASLKDVKIALDIVVDELRKSGVEVDLAEAKIKELEINITLDTDFDELQEVVNMLGCANSKNSLSIEIFRDELIQSLIKKSRTLYMNNRGEFEKSRGKTIRVYDKTFEMKKKQKIKLDRNITRVELALGVNYFAYAMKKKGFDNRLITLLTNDCIIELFREGLEREFIINADKQLMKMKKTLLIEFKNFKRTEKVKRTVREKLKKSGKDIPSHYREERGVFKYLSQNAWIFDYNFLIEIVYNHVEKKHIKIYERQIIKNYLKLNNYEVYSHFIEKLFGKNFFPTNSKTAGEIKLNKT